MNFLKRRLKTQYLNPETDPAAVEKAGEILRNGGLVAIPTETVYGLAANALSERAAAKIYTAKGRPSDNPLIVHIADPAELYPLAAEIPDSAEILAQRFWPGPLTLIFKRSGLTPKSVSGGLDTLAVRMPAHPVARSVIRAAGVPLAAPSANPSGKPSPTRAAHCLRDLNGRIDAVLEGGDCAVGVESTVLDLTGPVPVILRPGGVTPEQIRALLPETLVSPAAAEKIASDAPVPSPGMKYKHYAPEAKMILVEGTRDQFTDYVNKNAAEGVFALCFAEDVPQLQVPCAVYGSAADPEEQARRLFAKLREPDEKGARVVYAHAPAKEGLSLAVYNRLVRACGFEIVRLGE